MNRRFSCLIGAQFFAALNDNFLKQIFLLVVVRSALGGDAGIDYQLQGAGTAVFAIPFLLFSSFAGNLSDRWEKGFVIRFTKAVELLVAAVATWGLFTDQLSVILGALLLLSTQSCFFSPAKYGILPELLPREKLSRGNGILQLTTYFAILLGTAMAGITLTLFDRSRIVSGYLMLLVAAIGWLLSLGVEGDVAQDPDRPLFEFPLRQMVRALEQIRSDLQLSLAVINFVFVWFVGSILMLNLNVYGMDNLGVNALWTSLLNVVLAVGLGSGSYLAGWLSGDRIRPDFVPLGGIGLSLFLLGLLVSGNAFYLSCSLIFAVGLAGGFFLIPVQTMTQERPPGKNRGEVLGLLNFFTYAGVLVASASYTVAVGTLNLAAPPIMALLGLVAFVLSLLLLLFFPRYRFF